MKASELKEGKRYWLEGAHRYATYIGTRTFNWAGKNITECIFQDIADARVRVKAENIERNVKETK